LSGEGNQKKKSTSFLKKKKQKNVYSLGPYR